MPVLKNSRHEKVAQLIAKGKSGDEAYKKAGYKPHRQNAHRLITNDDIASRIAELKENSAKKAEIDRAYILKSLHEIALEAREAGQFTPSINALVKLGEEACDMFIKKTEATVNVKRAASEFSDDALAAIIAGQEVASDTTTH